MKTSSTIGRTTEADTVPSSARRETRLSARRSRSCAQNSTSDWEHCHRQTFDPGVVTWSWTERSISIKGVRADDYAR